MDQLFANLPAKAQADIHTVKVQTVRVSFQNSEFEDIQNKSTERTAVRVIQDGKLGAVSSSKPNSEGVLLERAVDLARFGSPVAYSLPGAAALQSLQLVDEQVTQVDAKTMVDIADDLTQALASCDSRIQVMGGVQRSSHRVSLRNSVGFDGSYRQTEWQAFLGGQLVQGDDMLWFGEGLTSCQLITDLANLKREVIQQYQWAKDTVPMEAGSYPVIFVPGEVTHLITPFLACLNGKAVVRGISPWKEKLGEQLLDPRVTLADDATLPMKPSSRPFDREGTPAGRNLLIDGGVIKEMVLDLQSAAELGRTPTGNGTGTGAAPNHVVLQPGQVPLSQLIGQIDKGLIIYGSMGAWAGNPYSGNVNGTVSLGLKIEKGQIMGRVKDCMFSINSFRHFKQHIIGFSAETKDLGEATYPYVALDEVIISTK